MMAEEWYYIHDGQQVGPMTPDQLRQLADSGKLRPDSPVWKAGMAEWTPAARITGLFSAGQFGPPPLPPAGLSYASAPPTPQLEDQAAMRWLLPVGRSGWAIAAGYAGLFAFVIFPAPLALILGIIAIIDIRKHPEKHGMGRAIFGLAAGALFSLALLAILYARVAR